MSKRKTVILVVFAQNESAWVASVHPMSLGRLPAGTRYVRCLGVTREEAFAMLQAEVRNLLPQDQVVFEGGQ